MEKLQNDKSIKLKVLSGLLWKLMERGGTQGIQFIVQIILARLLLPEDYGIVALIIIFISLANVLVQGGFNTALIQKKSTDELDFSSVFYLNLFVATLLYISLFFLSPIIADFYDISQLVPVLRIMSLTLFFGVINSIQNAFISRKMQFRKLFFSSLSSTAISGIAGIIMAFKGFGVWALVWQQLIQHFITTMILWYIVEWKPKLLFSIVRIKGLFSFGWKVLVSQIIHTLYMNLESIVIGKMYSAEMLGFYNRGKQFPSMIVSNIDGAIQSVMLPTYAKYQDDKIRLKRMVRRSIVTSSFMVFPMMVLLGVLAEPIIELLLTEKWLPAVPFLQIYCITYALHPIHSANLQSINALGRSDISLKLEITKKIIGILILLFSVNYGVFAIAIGILISSMVSAAVNAFPNKILLNYSFKEQLNDVFPPMFLSLIMGLTISSIHLLDLEKWLTICLQVVLGIIIYLGLAYVFRLECFRYLIDTIKMEINKKNKQINFK